MNKKVLVLTSTGHVASRVVKQLIAKGAKVKAASRKAGAQFTGAESIVFDYKKPETYEAALADADRIFMLIPAGEMAPVELVSPFLQQALKDSQRKIVLMTAAGVEASEEIPYRKIELLVERSGAPYVFLRPSWFMDNFHTYWLPTIKSAGLIALPAEQAKTAFVDVEDIAACAVAALLSDHFDKRAYTLTGPEALTYSEAAKILSDATQKSIQYKPIDDKTFISALTGAGVPQDYANFMAFLFSNVRQGYSSRVSDGVQVLLGRAPRSLAQYAQTHATLLK